MSTPDDLGKALNVRISRAADIVWEGKAKSVSSTNSTGSFDILPAHAHFLSIVFDKPIVVKRMNGVVREYYYAQSVIHVKDNQVNIYADISGGESISEK